MSHTDTHLDALPQHLGTAYYGSLHGKACIDDVNHHAADTVEEYVHDQRGPSQPGVTTPGYPPQPRSRRWARHVRDVMTTAVVTVDRLAPYKEIARLLVESRSP